MLMWGVCVQETRYRQRYLDLIMNGDVRNIFVTRSRVVQYMRSFFDTRGFLEVSIARGLHPELTRILSTRFPT